MVINHSVQAKISRVASQHMSTFLDCTKTFLDCKKTFLNRKHLSQSQKPSIDYKWVTYIDHKFPLTTDSHQVPHSASLEILISSLYSAPLDQYSAILNATLSTLSNDTRLDTALLVLDAFSSTYEEATGAVSTLWQYIARTQIWKPRYSNLTEFKRSVDYNTSIKPILTASTSQSSRLNRFKSQIESNWGKPLDELFVRTRLKPNTFSYNLVRDLAKLSKISPAFEDALVLIRREVTARRKSKGFLSKSPAITTVDVQNVINHIQRSGQPFSMHHLSMANSYDAEEIDPMIIGLSVYKMS